MYHSIYFYRCEKYTGIFLLISYIKIYFRYFKNKLFGLHYMLKYVSQLLNIKENEMKTLKLNKTYVAVITSLFIPLSGAYALENSGANSFSGAMTSKLLEKQAGDMEGIAIPVDNILQVIEEKVANQLPLAEKYAIKSDLDTTILEVHPTLDRIDGRYLVNIVKIPETSGLKIGVLKDYVPAGNNGDRHLVIIPKDKNGGLIRAELDADNNIIASDITSIGGHACFIEIEGNAGGNFDVHNFATTGNHSTDSGATLTSDDVTRAITFKMLKKGVVLQKCLPSVLGFFAEADAVAAEKAAGGVAA